MILVLHRRTLLSGVAVALSTLGGGCQEEKGKTPKVLAPSVIQSISPGFFDFQVPLAPPSPVVTPAPVLPPPSPLLFPDPQPLEREERARYLRGLRQSRVRRILQQEAPALPALRLKDPDYQQWHDATFEATPSTLPVDRARILTADMRIPALLEDALNSQIGGRVIAVVPRDVFSPEGRFILIPAYSRLICHYGPLAEASSSRLALTCSRLIRPDGVSLALHNSPAADQAGRMGLIGELEDHVGKQYAAAFLLAGLSAVGQGVGAAMGAALGGTGGSRSVPSTPPGPYGGGPSWGTPVPVPASAAWLGTASQELSQNVSQVTAHLIEKTLNLPPVLSIPAGTLIHILPERDIVLRSPVASRPASRVSGTSTPELTP